MQEALETQLLCKVFKFPAPDTVVLKLDAHQNFIGCSKNSNVRASPRFSDFN